MDAYLLFGAENTHPFAWLLNKQHRHVWCIVADHDAGMWVSYNWHQGLPIVRVESSFEFDIASYYRDEGWTVFNLDHIERTAVQGPFVLTNCVGHVKSVLGIGGSSLVPNQLFKYIMRLAMKGVEPIITTPITVPGFGGASAPPPPTHFSDGTAINPDGSSAGAPKSANAIAADKTLAEAEAKRKKLAVGNETSGTLLDDDESDEGTLT
jgi:hypothetical protein